MIQPRTIDGSAGRERPTLPQPKGTQFPGWGPKILIGIG